ncbi:MAG TPA: hypothetical protein VGA40_07155 [Candidatus Acidoferrales bacterium]
METDPRRAPQPRDEASSPHRQCPLCGSTEVRRSHRRGLAEAVLNLFGVKPYRCQRCDHRFRAASSNGNGK